MNGRERAEAGAADWIARRERDDWGELEQARLEAWIAASVDNRIAWLRLGTAWDQTERLRSLLTTSPPESVPSPQEMRIPFFDETATQPAALATESGPATGSQLASSRNAGRHLALVACIVIVIGAFAAWQSARKPGYRTEVGALQAIPLVDGSRVILNTNTNIQVEVTQTERRVSLEHGEAFFEVAKDRVRPFVVEAGGRRIVAVGTQFSVRRDAGEVRVLVTEGTVRLESAGAVPSGQPATAHPAETLLKAGSIARADMDSVLVHEKPLAEVEQMLSWRSGYLVFDRTPLAEAVAEFNRYNARQIVIDDPRVAAVPVGGNFRATNVEAFVRLIASDLSITATRQGNKIILSAMSPP